MPSRTPSAWWSTGTETEVPTYEFRCEEHGVFERDFSMADMPQDFWSGWVAVITIVTLIALVWLVWSVYFSGDGEIFRTGDVRVAVWQKEPPGRRMLCYCFGENEAAMQHEIQTTGRTLAVNRVRHHISERRCACDVRNPRGSCCLGDLMRATRQFESQEPEPA